MPAAGSQTRRARVRRTYLQVDAEGARAAARAMDGLRRVRAEPSPYAGIPVSVKDLFDVRGQVTRAGSRALDGPPGGARRDRGRALAARRARSDWANEHDRVRVQRARDEPPLRHPGEPVGPRTAPDPGRLVVGGGGVGRRWNGARRRLAPTPAGRAGSRRRCAGSSDSSRPRTRVPRDGLVPLSPTLDAVGVLGRSVGCCAVLDALLLRDDQPRAAAPAGPAAAARRPPQLSICATSSPCVAAAFERAVGRLRDGGAEVVDVEWPELDRLPEMNAGGGFPGSRELRLAPRPDRRARRRIRPPRARSHPPRRAANRARPTPPARAARGVDRAAHRRLEGFDAIICPTVPIVAPPLDALDDDTEYARINLLDAAQPDGGQPPRRLRGVGADARRPASRRRD